MASDPGDLGPNATCFATKSYACLPLNPSTPGSAATGDCTACGVGMRAGPAPAFAIKPSPPEAAFNATHVPTVSANAIRLIHTPVIRFMSACPLARQLFAASPPQHGPGNHDPNDIQQNHRRHKYQHGGRIWRRRPDSRDDGNNQDA